MAERRKIPWKLRVPLLIGGYGLVVAAGTYLVVDAQSGGGGDQFPAVSGEVLDLLPTPTVTPLIFESPFESLVPTGTHASVLTAAPAGTVPSSDKGGPETVEPSTVTPGLVWTPPPVAVPTFVLTSPPTPEPTPAPIFIEKRYRDDVADELFTLINQFRAKNGEFALLRSSYLDVSARAYAMDFYEKGDYTHPVHNLGGEPTDRVNAVSTPGHLWFWAGDVMSIGSNSAAVVMGAWENSPGHRAALLSFPNDTGQFDTRIVAAGVSCYEGPNINQGAPGILVAVCVGSLGIPLPSQ